jgi:hypothetical protein
MHLRGYGYEESACAVAGGCARYGGPVSRRLLAALPATLVALAVAAGPGTAFADPPAASGGGPPVVAAPGNPPGTSDGGSSGSGSTGTGTSTGGDGTAGNGQSGSGTTAGAGSGATGSDGAAASRDTTSHGKAKTAKKDKPSAARTAKPENTRASTPSVASTRAASSESGELVRARAAPAATDTGITALLPQPDPLLLPGSVTTQAAPVSAEHSSPLAFAIPALVLGAAVLSVGIGGAALARRRHRRAPA